MFQFPAVVRSFLQCGPVPGPRGSTGCQSREYQPRACTVSRTGSDQPCWGPGGVNQAAGGKMEPVQRVPEREGKGGSF